MNAIAKLVFLGALGSLGLAGSAHAVTNGNFGAGLSGWDALGDASVQSGRAFLTTASLDYEDDAGHAAGAFNFSGTSAAGVGFPAEVEGFLGMAPGALDPDLNNGIAANEGSALRQTFGANAGDKLSFSWQFYSNENSYADYAFVVIDGQRIELANAIGAGTVASSPFSFQSGVASFDYTFTQSGAHTLAFGVVDVVDYNQTSALAIGNVQITAVPEPEAYAMLLAGLGVITAARRRRH